MLVISVKLLMLKLNKKICIHKLTVSKIFYCDMSIITTSKSIIYKSKRQRLDICKNVLLLLFGAKGRINKQETVKRKLQKTHNKML